MAIRLQGNAIDLAVWKAPTRNVTDRHGEPAIEKLPTQRSRYMLNPAGHGVWVALHSGSGNRNPNDPQAIRILDEKMRKGFLPFDRCPQTMESVLQSHLPEAVRGRAACSTGIDPSKPIGSSNPCKCLKETETFRTKLNDKKMAEIQARYTSKEDKDRALRERQIEALEKRNAQIEKSK